MKRKKIELALMDLEKSQWLRTKPLRDRIQSIEKSHATISEAFTLYLGLKDRNLAGKLYPTAVQRIKKLEEELFSLKFSMERKASIEACEADGGHLWCLSRLADGVCDIRCECGAGRRVTLSDMTDEDRELVHRLLGIGIEREV